MRRTWVKLYSHQWLYGTLRSELEPAERSIWADFLAMAGDSPFPGKICVSSRMGFTDQQLADLLVVDIKILQSAKTKMVKYDKIYVDENGVIEILNWFKYQSEYLRQKPHRNPEFIKLRESIKERDDYTCQECFKDEEALAVPLCVHHIDGDPKNNKTSNLITMCISCHSKLLKKNVHKTKQKEIKEQELKYREKVQEKSSNKKCNIEKEEEEEEEKKKTIYRSLSGKLQNEISPEDVKTAFSACKENDDNISEEDIDDEFDQMWKNFPGDSTTKGNKQEAKVLFHNLRKKVYADVIAAGFRGYSDLLLHKKVNENFEQRPMNVARFLRKGNWLVNICFKFQSRL